MSVEAITIINRRIGIIGEPQSMLQDTQHSLAQTENNEAISQEAKR